jgi:hypothetical protein
MFAECSLNMSMRMGKLLEIVLMSYHVFTVSVYQLKLLV